MRPAKAGVEVSGNYVIGYRCSRLVSALDKVWWREPDDLGRGVVFLTFKCGVDGAVVSTP